MEILFLDENIVVCIKPIGLDSEHDVPNRLCDMLQGPFLPVHRLDKQVGGVMVYARNRATAALLSKLIQSGEMVKEYVAWVHGVVPDTGEWTDFLWKDNSKNKVFVVKRMRGGVKVAKLSYVKIRDDGDRSLVRVRLYTGRSHQIRVQFSSRGYPLLGDRKYGSKSGLAVPMLFSCSITFPYHGTNRCFEIFPSWI